MFQQIKSHGGTPNTKFIQSLGEDVVTSRGLVRTNPTLEVVGHSGIFCIGDVVDNNERNRLAKYGKHANVVIKNIFQRLSGKEPTTKYGGAFETIRISLGKARRLKHRRPSDADCHLEWRCDVLGYLWRYRCRKLVHTIGSV